MDPPVKLKSLYTESGRAVGEVENLDYLFQILEESSIRACFKIEALVFGAKVFPDLKGISQMFANHVTRLG